MRMNKIFKVIWCYTHQCYVVVSRQRRHT
ncbi:TPA: hypothetical protein SLN76_003674 [Morganella morganii]|nr:hypothetical protein [Morganella morganii]